MKILFYAGLAGLVAFEVLNVYFIMPMPGSQRMNSLDLAYFLYTWRWVFRGVFALAILISARGALRAARWWQPALLLVAAGVVWMFNFKMSADHMFREPVNPVYLGRAESKVDESAVIIGIEHNGEAKAYPIRFIGYHHQVQDTVGGLPVLVTYCTVCRTGRVFEPVVDGKPERFRLVGMDHFNAMFEDATTGSWWRQVTGEAVTGKRKGMQLPERQFTQMTLTRWFALHPDGKVLQRDETRPGSFDPSARYERGKSEGDLTRTNPESWQDKSWVVGVEVGSTAKAFDWNRLKKERVINAEVGGTPIVLALAKDLRSFVVFERPAGATFALEGEQLVADGRRYDFAGRELPDPRSVVARQLTALKPATASQEFWHSWRTFYPATQKDEVTTHAH